jgi:hypothetical protein
MSDLFIMFVGALGAGALAWATSNPYSALAVVAAYIIGVVCTALMSPDSVVVHDELEEIMALPTPELEVVA